MTSSWASFCSTTRASLFCGFERGVAARCVAGLAWFQPACLLAPALTWRQTVDFTVNAVTAHDFGQAAALMEGKRFATGDVLRPGRYNLNMDAG
jgi:hypothetical protein